MAAAITTQRISDVLAGAIAVIETRGFRRDDDPVFGEAVTVLEAISVASGRATYQPPDVDDPAVCAVVAHLGLSGGEYALVSLAGWSAAYGRTAGEVVAVLRSIAAILREEGR